MVDFIRAGGFNMFVLLAMGLVLVPLGILFARNAGPQRLSLIRALTKALGFATFAGFAAGLAATAKFAVGLLDREPTADPLPYLLMGFAESTTNLLLGAGIAFITWILVAVGVRRMPSDL